MSQSEEGSTSTEYAVILALIVIVVAMGAVMLSTRIRRSISDAEMTGETSSSSPAHRAAVSQRDNPSPPHRSLGHHVLPVAAIAVAVGLGLLFVTRMSQRREAPIEELEDPSTEEPDSLPEAAIFVRRQKLLQILLGDVDLLLKGRIQVRHVMTSNPLILSPSTSRDEVARSLAENSTAWALVSRSGQKPLGLVYGRDLGLRSGQQAQDLMAPIPWTVAPDTPLSATITRMVDQHVSCAVVVDDGSACGLVTSSDLAITIQSTLQMFLKIAQYVCAEPKDSSDLCQSVDSLHDQLNAHQTKVDQFARHVEQLVADQPDGPWQEVSQQATQMCRQTRQLAEQFGKASDVLQEQTRKLTSLFQLRTDPLTGVSNRQGLDETLSILCSTKQRYGHPFAIAVIQIRRRATDDMGSDDELRDFAQWVNRRVRDTELVARYDVDMLAVVMPCTQPEGAANFCERLLAAYRDRDSHFDHFDADLVTATVSSEDADSPEELLACAQDRLENIG